MVRIELENLYRVYKQSQNKNALLSEADLKQKLLKLKPGEILSVVVIEGGDTDDRREKIDSQRFTFS